MPKGKETISGHEWEIQKLPSGSYMAVCDEPDFSATLQAGSYSELRVTIADAIQLLEEEKETSE